MLTRSLLSSVLLLLLLLAAVPVIASDSETQIAAELDAARRTVGLLETKLVTQEGTLEQRVRTLYKLTRGGLAPLWLEEGERARLVRNRAAARRVILRDLEERKILRGELAAASAAESRLSAEATRAAVQGDALGPLPGSLRPPVAGRIAARFGPYAHAASKARLYRNGIELATERGDDAVAAAVGTVVWAGPVRGLGTAVLVDHGGGVVTLVGALAVASVAVGDQVAAGTPVGTALGDRIVFEVRRGGRPLDPTPLLHR